MHLVAFLNVLEQVVAEFKQGSAVPVEQNDEKGSCWRSWSGFTAFPFAIRVAVFDTVRRWLRLSVQPQLNPAR